MFQTTNQFLKVELIWLVRLWPLLFWFFLPLAITIEHSVWAYLNTSEVWNVTWFSYHIVLISSVPRIDSCTTNVCLNRDRQVWDLHLRSGPVPCVHTIIIIPMAKTIYDYIMVIRYYKPIHLHMFFRAQNLRASAEDLTQWHSHTSGNP